MALVAVLERHLEVERTARRLGMATEEDVTRAERRLEVEERRYHEERRHTQRRAPAVAVVNSVHDALLSAMLESGAVTPGTPEQMAAAGWKPATQGRELVGWVRSDGVNVQMREATATEVEQWRREREERDARLSGR